jgi:hypothetical protein
MRTARGVPETAAMSSTAISSQGGTEMIATALTDRRELAHRTSDGIEVTLFWTKPCNRVSITVLDTRSDEALEFEVDGSAALDAFTHPYAYAATPAARNLIATGVSPSPMTLATDL